MCGGWVGECVRADDANIYSHIKCIADKDGLQTGIVKWTDKWQVKLISSPKIGLFKYKRVANLCYEQQCWKKLVIWEFTQPPPLTLSSITYIE